MDWENFTAMRPPQTFAPESINLIQNPTCEISADTFRMPESNQFRSTIFIKRRCFVEIPVCTTVDYLLGVLVISHVYPVAGRILLVIRPESDLGLGNSFGLSFFGCLGNWEQDIHEGGIGIIVGVSETINDSAEFGFSGDFFDDWCHDSR